MTWWLKTEVEFFCSSNSNNNAVLRLTYLTFFFSGFFLMEFSETLLVYLFVYMISVWMELQQVTNQRTKFQHRMWFDFSRQSSFHTKRASIVQKETDTQKYIHRIVFFIWKQIVLHAEYKSLETVYDHK